MKALAIIGIGLVVLGIADLAQLLLRLPRSVPTLGGTVTQLLIGVALVVISATSSED